MAPRQLLDDEFTNRPDYWEPRPRIWIHSSVYGNDGCTYSKFCCLYKDELVSRTYEIENVNGRPGILWLDRIHDVTRDWPVKTVPLEDAAILWKGSSLRHEERIRLE